MKCIIASSVLIVSIFFSSIAQITVNLPLQDTPVERILESAEYSERSVFGEPGEPSLPVYVCSVLLPPNTDLKTLTFSIEGLKESKLVGLYDIKPILPPTTVTGLVAWPNERNIVDGRDVTVYTQDAVYPQNHIKVIQTGQLNCFKLVTVKVSTFRYNPITKTLYQVQKGALKIDYKIDPKYRAPFIKIPVSVQNRLKRKVVNYNEFFGSYAPNCRIIQNDVLAIITTNNIKGQLSSFDAFVAAKETMGIEVIVATEDEWGGGTGSTGSANIRTWLQDNYQSQGINYCFLIGDPSNTSGDVPMAWFTGYSPWAGHEDCPADWHYAQLTGDYKSDKTCELSVGRFPIFSGDYSGTDKIMQKTINYGNSSPEDAKWRFNALLGGPGYDASSTSWKAMNPAYHDWIEPDPEWEAFRCYSSMYATPQEADLVSSNIAPTWAEGTYGIVDWAAHGSPTSAQGAMSASSTASVGNDYPSFALCGSCSNAAITTSGNLTYSILKNCGVGGLGGTDYTMVGDDMVWCRYYIKYLVPEKMTMGQTMTELLENHSSGWYNRGPYVLYGDPTIGCYSFNSEPFIGVLNPNGGEEIEQYTTHVIKWSDNILGKVKIELFKGGTLLEVLAEEAESNGSLEWEVTGDYEIADDYKIRITSIDSNALTSESKDPFSVVPEFIIGTFPYFKNLDDLTSGGAILPEKWMQQSDDDLDWTVLSGPTPSKTGSDPDKTGPDADHTTQSDGNYLYVEASSNENKKAVAVSPKFNLKDANEPKLSFWAHMFSADNTMGTLSLDICVDGTWKNDVLSLTDDHGDEWFLVEQKLDDYKGDRVLFRLNGVTGSSWCSDICIDDFKVETKGNSILSTLANVADFGLRYTNSRIVYQVPVHASGKKMTVKLFNVQGKLVRTLVNGKVSAGRYNVPLAKENLAAALYLCQIKTEGFTKTINVIVQK